MQYQKETFHLFILEDSELVFLFGENDFLIKNFKILFFLFSYEISNE